MSTWPVMLIGSGLGTLGAVRLLHRRGLRTLCFGPPGIESRSRYYERAPGLPSAGEPMPDLARYLASGAIDHAVLIPCTDAGVNAIAILPVELRSRFPASVPEPEFLAQLTDKGPFADLLERLDIPRPTTRTITRLEQLSELPDSAFTNAFLKPRDSQKFHAQFGLKGMRAASRDEAMAKLQAPLAAGLGMVLQEYVQGPASNHYLIDGFVDRNGRITTMFGRHRLRMFPLDFGNSSYMVSVPLESIQPAADALAKIVTSGGYRGIFSGEFKRDERDGQYKLLEINTRVWWFVEYAGRCGVDLCEMSYQDALGLDVAPVTSYPIGAAMVHPYFDYFAVKALAAEGKLGLIEGYASWFRAQQPHFNWLDPMPAIVDVMEHSPLKAAKRWLGGSQAAAAGSKTKPAR
ncbi:MAG: hypothetical protein JSS20_05275 [Proteobacteria bacterium]|nr:hypothetical protein [Pseudomonadota bacterium]